MQVAEVTAYKDKALVAWNVTFSILVLIKSQ